MYALRPYQRDCIAGIRKALEEFPSTLAVKPTGTGKTVVLSTVAKQWIDEGKGRVLLVAHRDELISQGAEKLRAICQCEVAIEKGEEHSVEGYWGKAPIVCTSVQTMSRPKRMARFRPEDFGLVIIDEAHHAPAASYRAVIKHFSHSSTKLLGVTATPDRADEEALGQIFESVGYEYQLPTAIHDGWLVPIDQRLIVVDSLDLSNVRTTAGDLNAGDLDRILLVEENLHKVVKPTIDLAGDQTTLVFAASVMHAERMAEIFNRHQAGSAYCIHGGTDPEERRELLRRYKSGDFQFLCNCGVFLEGFDEPRVGVVAMARPTKSRALYAQAIGRGTRPLPGVVDGIDDADGRREAICCSSKPAVLVLDFVGNSGRHKLVTSADILGGNINPELPEESAEEVIERAKREVARKSRAGESVDMLAEIERQEKIVEEELRKKRESLRLDVTYATNKVDPFDFFEVSQKREPGWHKGRQPTPKMIEVLERNGIATKGLSFWRAHQLMDGLIARRQQGLCTFKQSKTLARAGYRNTETYSFEQASKLIDALARNGWRKPEEPHANQHTQARA